MTETIMAKLISFNSGKWDKDDGESWDDYDKRTSGQLSDLFHRSDALANGEIVGGLISFPVADGMAFYLVISASPLMVAHIPYGDAYMVNPILIRGLRADDVRRQLTLRRKINSLFPKKGQ